VGRNSEGPTWPGAYRPKRSAVSELRRPLVMDGPNEKVGGFVAVFARSAQARHSGSVVRIHHDDRR